MCEGKLTLLTLCFTGNEHEASCVSESSAQH